LAGLLFENRILRLNEGDSATQSEKAVSDRVNLAREIAARTEPASLAFPATGVGHQLHRRAACGHARGLTVEKYREQFMRKRGKK
jgi:hypothetical protein